MATIQFCIFKKEKYKKEQKSTLQLLIEKTHLWRASLNVPCFRGEKCWSLSTMHLSTLLPILHTHTQQTQSQNHNTSNNSLTQK